MTHNSPTKMLYSLSLLPKLIPKYSVQYSAPFEFIQAS